jgi:cytochrome P450
VYKHYIHCYKIILNKAASVIADKVNREKEREKRTDLPKEFIDYIDFLLKNDVDAKQQLRLAGTMFVGGIDTTAKAMAWVFYCLAKNPESQDKIAAEIAEAQKGSGSDEPLTHDQIQRLPYLRATVKECTRVWPAVLGTNRLLEKDIELGGYRIPAGTIMHPSTWVTGKNPAVHKDPNVFRPERWLEGTKHNPFGLLLFGHGPRMCPGRRIAESELHLACAELCRRFKLSTEQTAESVLMTMMQPAVPLKIKFERRK